jgi:hypothetical protein
MAARRDRFCGARFRRAALDLEPSPVVEDDDVALTPLGAAFMDALRQDERYRDIMADPFGEHGTVEGTD